MAFNINDFQGNIAKYGTLRSHSFDVEFALPKTFQNRFILTPGAGQVSTGQLGRMLQMRVEQVKIPGVAIQNAEINRYGVGTAQKIPFASGFVDTSFSFIIDKYGALWYFWYTWLRDTVQFAGLHDNPGSMTFNEFASYCVGYKDDIVSTMTFRMFDAMGDVALTIELIDAFPISLNDMQVDWNETNQLVRVTIGLSFKEIILKGAGTITSTTTTGPGTTNNRVGGGSTGPGSLGNNPFQLGGTTGPGSRTVVSSLGLTQTPTP
jgi:hypothetical protein